jgi:thiol-disulfide isomerase/thioredoxin
MRRFDIGGDNVAACGPHLNFVTVGDFAHLATGGGSSRTPCLTRDQRANGSCVRLFRLFVRPRRALPWSLGASLLSAACQTPSPADSDPQVAPAAPSAANDGAEAREAPPAQPRGPELRPAGDGPELRPAGDGPVAPLVQAARAEAEADGRPLVVYVGASWCEPCVAFHDAVAAGELTEQLPPARFLEFDLDRDQQRLAEAGYTSRLIPLFVIPDADGRASAERMEGGVKGPRAVANLVGRLQPLLADHGGR